MPKRVSLYALFFAALAFFFLVSYAALAQDSATPLVVPSADGSGWDLRPFFDNLVQFVASVLILVLTWVVTQVTGPLNKWLGTKFEADEIVKDLKMRENAQYAINEAMNWVKQQTGVTDDKLKDIEIRNPALSLAAGFLLKQYPEVWTWIATSEKGVTQYIEAHLAPASALPPNVVPGVGPVTPAPVVKP